MYRKQLTHMDPNGFPVPGCNIPERFRNYTFITEEEYQKLQEKEKKCWIKVKDTDAKCIL